MGLDISTTTIGIAVLDFDSEGKATPILIDFYKPIKHTIEDKNQDFLYTLSTAKRHILNLIREYQPDHIAVEDYIRFLKGRSSSATTIPLGILNRTICLSIYEQYSQTPLHICNVMSIRTRIKKDCSRQDLPPKEEIPELLEKLLNITIPRPMQKTRKGEKIATTHFDMTDAVAVAYYCYRLLKENK